MPILQQITDVAAQYGWTVNRAGKCIQLTNRKGFRACSVTTVKNRFRIEDSFGKLLYSGTNVATCVEAVLSKYFYAQKVQVPGWSEIDTTTK